MKTLLCAALLALPSGAGAARTAPSVSAASATFASPAQARHSVEQHYTEFIESIEQEKKQAALVRLARTPPATFRDVRALFDLFSRFPDPAVRDAVLSSVGLLGPEDRRLEPAFIEYLKLPESAAKFFGTAGALRLRAPHALPMIQEFAEQRFAHKSPGETPVLSDKNAWWARYEALSALAEWQGAEALPLLRRKADEAPAVAALIARHMWKEAFPDIVKWAQGGRSAKEKAHEALTAQVPLEALRQTRQEMLRLMRDPKADRELRHQLAIKVGASSADEDIDALLAEHASAKHPETRLTFSAALFASRSPKTIPWLKELLAADRDPKMRFGALTQLRLLLPPAEFRVLAESFAANDPDAENRELAAEMLQRPAP